MCMGIRKTPFSKSEATPLYKIRPGIANLTFIVSGHKGCGESTT